MLASSLGWLWRALPAQGCSTRLTVVDMFFAARVVDACCALVQAFATVTDPAAAAQLLLSIANLPQENVITDHKPQSSILPRTGGRGVQLAYRTSAQGPPPTDLARCVASKGNYVDVSGDIQTMLSLPPGRQINVTISDAAELVMSLCGSGPDDEAMGPKLNALLREGLESGEVAPLPCLSVPWRQAGKAVTALAEGNVLTCAPCALHTNQDSHELNPHTPLIGAGGLASESLRPAQH
jgi:hypothetical protein